MSEDGSKFLDRWDSFTLAYSTFIIFIFLSHLLSVISAWHVIGTQWMMVMISASLSRFEEISIQPILRVTVSPAFPETVRLLFLCKMAHPFILQTVLVWMINYINILTITRDFKNVTFFNAIPIWFKGRNFSCAAVFPQLLSFRYQSQFLMISYHLHYLPCIWKIIK